MIRVTRTRVHGRRRKTCASYACGWPLLQCHDGLHVEIGLHICAQYPTRCISKIGSLEFMIHNDRLSVGYVIFAFNLERPYTRTLHLSIALTIQATQWYSGRKPSLDGPGYCYCNRHHHLLQRPIFCELGQIVQVSPPSLYADTCHVMRYDQ